MFSLLTAKPGCKLPHRVGGDTGTPPTPIPKSLIHRAPTCTPGSGSHPDPPSPNPTSTWHQHPPWCRGTGRCPGWDREQQKAPPPPTSSQPREGGALPAGCPQLPAHPWVVFKHPWVQSSSVSSVRGAGGAAGAGGYVLQATVLLGAECKGPLETPTFGDIYHVTGTISLPYAEIREPFEAWYNLTGGKSRIEYYGGQVVTYQFGSIEPFGASFKVTPETTETEINIRKCFRINGTSGDLITPQSIFPSLENFKTGVLTPLSQQVLIDCSWGFGNYACDGGEEWRAYEWIKKHGGVASTESYGPYLGQNGYCRCNHSELVAPLAAYAHVAPKAALVKHGPVAVNINASHKSFTFYPNGVYEEPQCGNETSALDHAVLAVGYGVLHGKGYWLIKNSWSTYWGHDGYILMAMKDNNCGVATAASFPILA